MTHGRQTKNRIFEQFARIGHAMASPKRLELLDLLCQSEKTVDTLARDTTLTVANTSRHLQILRTARLVETRRQGLFIYYRLADKEVCRFFRSLSGLAASRLAEVDQIVRDYFDQPSKLQPIDRKKLLKKARLGEVIILDVRPNEEYISGHIPYAQSVPLSQLKNHLVRFSPDRMIVAYCRGPYCVLAQEAVKILRNHGLEAMRLADDPSSWAEAGLSIVAGEK